MNKATVYFTKEITAESLIKIYEAMGRELRGKVAVKISSGEAGGHNFLNAKMIQPLVNKLNGTIVECNTACPGRRQTAADHWQVIKEHGFYDIAPCDIMDEDGEIRLPVRKGNHLEENIIGSHFANYDSMLVLSHFKGHIMGGFGGALKNISIGIASSYGKGHIHCSGAPYNTFDDACKAPHDDFLESMADASSSVIDFIGRRNVACINVANKLSVDCDCMANPADPCMHDIGIFASLDPVAVDQACIDAIYASHDPGKDEMIERMETRNGFRTLEAAVQLNIGTREYELVCLD